MTAPVTSNPETTRPLSESLRSMLREHAKAGCSLADIVRGYPLLTAAQIEAALAWPPTTKGDPRAPAIICRERGWAAGTRLVGRDSSGPTVIEITAVGEGQVLAKRVTDDYESSWCLSARAWQVVAGLAGESG